MNKHARMSIRSGQARANERLRDNRVRPIIAFADAAPETTTCQYVMGDRYMCGAPALPGKPYCSDHWALTHRPYDGDDAA